MDHKEQVSAANALVEWFNSQEVAPSDATLVMSKLIAKLIIGSGTRATSHLDVYDALDAFTLQLVHDINERLYSVRRRK